MGMGIRLGFFKREPGHLDKTEVEPGAKTEQGAKTS